MLHIPWRRGSYHRAIPHYYLEHQVDVTGCEEFLSRINAGRPPDNRLLMGALVLKAVASAARRFPAFNGFYQDGRFTPCPSIHAGVAIAIRGGGLAAPAIYDSDQLTLDELMVRMRDLIQRVRAGRIRSSEMADPTITISSLGERGVEALYEMIYPPQLRSWALGRSASALGSLTAASCRVPSLRSRLPRTTGLATVTPVHCSSPKSPSGCRIRTDYERC